MRKRLLGGLVVALLAALCLSPTGAWADDQGVAIDAINFPDQIFREGYVETYDTDSDGWLSDDEIAAVTEIDCWDKGISSLKEVEHFTSLTYLSCGKNALTSLDVSQNAVLTGLSCPYNQLGTLDLSHNTALLSLDCSANTITSLDLTHNAKLEYLDCSNNRLTSLSLSSNAPYYYEKRGNNSYTIGIDANRQLDLSKLPSGFDINKASGWNGGNVTDGVLTVNDEATSVTYTYDCGAGKTANFTLNVGYAVSFDTGGGSAVDSQTIEAGGKATEPAGPTWAQHVFGGWYVDSNYTQAYDFETMTVTGPTTIYAKWVEDSVAPVVSDVEDGKTYCSVQEITVTDEHLASVELDGEVIELASDHTSPVFRLVAGSEHTIVATDKAGNTTTVTVTVNDGHTWGESWSHNATEHWRGCSVCGERTDVAKHAYSAANCVTPAICYTCEEEYGGVDPYNHYMLDHEEAKAATTEAEGNVEFWYCHDCSKYFSDAAGTKEIAASDIIIPKLDPNAPVITGVVDGKAYCAAQKAAVADENLASVTLDGADVALSDGQTTCELDLAATGQHTIVATDKAGNTTTVSVTVNNGHTWSGSWSHNTTEHWHECSVCGEKTDVAKHGTSFPADCVTPAICYTCEDEYSEPDPNNHHRPLVHEEAKAATTEAEGNAECWYCGACDRYFSDAAGTKEISASDTVIPKLDPKKAEAPDGSKDDSTDGKTDDAKPDGEEPGKSQVSRTGDSTAAAWPLAILGAAALAAVLVSARRRRS